ncbi:MAG: VOC family protein [Gordonia sp. (in: high G+C Gram-positive bacteria)]|uniref:VOC family protein n=1 Tax=Gordonia sp. (in: high G+C Gram-positive bacteria) TaxID=84139 RepID=UPI0039E720DA
MSLMVDCESVEELQRIFAALGDGGTVFMPLDDYGFGPFGWVGDRFVLTWQLGVPAT